MLLKTDVIIDFTIPKRNFEVLKIVSKLKKVVIEQQVLLKEKNLIKKYSKKFQY